RQQPTRARLRPNAVSCNTVPELFGGSSKGAMHDNLGGPYQRYFVISSAKSPQRSFLRSIHLSSTEDATDVDGPCIGSTQELIMRVHRSLAFLAVAFLLIQPAWAAPRHAGSAPTSLR